jgi:hypothetical protein
MPMADQTFSVVVTDNASQEAVAFPATPEKIGKFISGLLGQPQTISREISAIFDVDLSWFNHIHAVIEQRIKQQNEAARTAFRAKIFYDGDLTRTVESVEGLQHFAETKKVRSTGIELHWSYVIKFPGKDLPEKQEITLRVEEKGTEFVTIGLQPSKIRQTSTPGRITYSVSHTERTWGDDIETILRQEIELITKKTKWYENYFESAFMILGLIFLVGGFLFPDYMNDRLQTQALTKIQPEISQISDPQVFAKLDTSKKLDLIAQFVNPANAVPKVGIKYRIVSAVAGFALLSMCIFWSEIRRASHVVLTKEAELHRALVLEKEKRRFLMILISFAVSIAAGVLGNYAYLYLTT